MASGEGPAGRSHRIRRWLQDSGCLAFKREPIARGIGIGLLIGFTPTVGFQTVMMLGACLWLRGNFPAAFTMSWVSNPFTLPPMIYAYYQLGDWLFGSWVKARFVGTGGIDEAMIGVVNTALGCALIAIPMALIGYFASLGISEVWNRRRHAAREERRASARRSRAAGTEPPPSEMNNKR